MKSISILNNSINSIIFLVTFKEKDESYLTEEKTPLFGINVLKTINIPDDCSNIIISIKIKVSYAVFVYACSIFLSNATDKKYEFVGSHKLSGLFEINPNNINHNTNFIYLFNKSISRVKGELSFNIGKSNFNQATTTIEKKHSVALSIPINAKNVKFIVSALTLIDKWIIVDTIELNNPTLKKCYEVVDKKLYTSFSIKEITCSSIKIP